MRKEEENKGDARKCPSIEEHRHIEYILPI
jgi:hypothetical protein